MLRSGLVRTARPVGTPREPPVPTPNPGSDDIAR